MNVYLTPTGNHFDVLVTGNVDTQTAPEFMSATEQLRALKNGSICIDCKKMEYISSTGLRAFVILLKTAKANNTTLTIKNLVPAVKEVFDITGFSHIFHIEQPD